jgi:hypothetical protein
MKLGPKFKFDPVHHGKHPFIACSWQITMLVASFNHDQLEALTKLVMELCHNNIFAMKPYRNLAKPCEHLCHVMSGV